MKHHLFRLAIAVLLLASSTAALADGAAPSQLRCEYLENPQGIDITAPRLSWKLEASPEARGLRQTAYRVLVASTPELLAKDEGDLWDSGKVASDQSVQVPYAGKSPGSHQICHWKVKVWTSDLEGKVTESAWSMPQNWSMGLLKPEDWNAKWISMTPSRWEPDPSTAPELDLEGANWIRYEGGEANKDTNAAAAAGAASPKPPVHIPENYFRKTVSIPGSLRTASITLTADQEFSLRLNGELLGKSPLMPDAWRKPLSVDLKEKLRQGDNLLEIVAMRKPTDVSMMAAIKIVPDQGAPIDIVTDASWQAAQKGDAPPEAWRTAKIIAPYGAAPWGKFAGPGKPKPGGDLTSRNSPMLRKTFVLTKPVKEAQASICGLGYYEMFLNGAKVGDHVLDPAITPYHGRALYVTYDLSKELKQGTNALGVQLANGIYNQEFADAWNFQGAPWRAFPQMLLQLDVTYEDGTRERIVSDASWKVSDGPLYWDQLRMGVMYDARREHPGWDTPAFDDSAWQAAILREGPKGKLDPQMSEPIKVMETLGATNIVRQGDSYLFDFGKNISGWTRLKVSGKAGTEIVMDHGQQGIVIGKPLQTDIYTLKGSGEEVWEPGFAFHGFSKVTVSGLPGEPTKEMVEARVVRTAFDERGEFECSNPLLNRLVEISRRSYVGNFVGIPTDCPHREKCGWTADAYLASEAGLTYYGSEAAYTRWILDFEAAQASDGKLPCIIPDGGPGADGMGWGMRFLDGPAWESAYLIIPWNIYEYRGDRRILERHYENWKRWLAWYRDESKVIDKKSFVMENSGGSKDSRYKNPQNVNQGNIITYGIGDWPPNGLTPFEITSTASYYNAAMILSRTAGLLGKTAEQKEYADLAAQTKEAFNRAFYDEATGTYSKGSDTGMSCALYFGLVDDKNRQKVADILAERLKKKDDTLTVGCLGSKYLLRALAETGHADTAYRIVTKTTTPGWGFLASSNRTTLTEKLDGGGSDNHAFLGDVASWIMTYLGGIRVDPAHPGFQRFLIKPEVVGDLTWVKARHTSPYGGIVSDWKKEGDRFSLDLTVPPNSTAEVSLPTDHPDSVTESGKPVAVAPGVRILRGENGRELYEAGAGSYHFECRMNQQTPTPPTH